MSYGREVDVGFLLIQSGISENPGLGRNFVDFHNDYHSLPVGKITFRPQSHRLSSPITDVHSK